MNVTARLAALILPLSLLAACERPPMDTSQRGYRGLAIGEVVNPRLEAEVAAVNVAPATLPAAAADGPKASEVYQNVKVLGHLSVAEFTRAMQAMTEWVSPKEGCAYCHDLQNLADESKYQKIVSRRMLEMTRHVNNDWKAHVGATGVTCYTCHRGNHIPEAVWFQPAAKGSGMVGYRGGQNAPASTVAFASVPNDPFSAYLQGNGEIRVAGREALPSGPASASIKQTEASFGLMLHMSQALGVNCTYCHNTRSFDNWGESTVPRLNAWHGIRMARDLNNNYLDPLAGIFPASRLGPRGDVAKVSCASCHNGQAKPLGGAPMAAAHPALTVVP